MQLDPTDLPCGLTDFSVRRLCRGDEERLAEFYESLSDRSRHFFEPQRENSLEMMTVVVDRTLAGEDLGLIALDPSGRVIAHLFYWHISRDVPHLGIGIRDEYQNLGLGATLFAYLVALGRHALKKQAVGLTLVKENARALHLYRKFGFRIVGDATFRQPNDSYEMRLDFVPREVAP